MVKNWNVSQMLPVPFTKWHFQISPHLHPFTVRCYFPYVNKRWFITPPRGKQILLNEVAGIFFCRRMNKHFPSFKSLACWLSCPFPVYQKRKIVRKPPGPSPVGTEGGGLQVGAAPSSLEVLVWPGSVLPNNLIYFSSLWSSCSKST